MCLVISRGQQIYTVIQAVHSLLYIVAKCHFFNLVTWKDIIKYKKMWGVYSLLWDTVYRKISGWEVTKCPPSPDGFHPLSPPSLSLQTCHPRKVTDRFPSPSSLSVGESVVGTGWACTRVDEREYQGNTDELTLGDNNSWPTCIYRGSNSHCAWHDLHTACLLQVVLTRLFIKARCRLLK